jgi:glycosyltransferase involved in cell wall biosynthesis
MLAKHQGDRHQFYVLHHHNNRDLCYDLVPNFHWLECPNFGENWPARLWWQFTQLGALLRELKAELIISTSGALVPGTGLPQIVIAQNPWCYIPQFHYSAADKLKAWLQRQGYRQAQKHAQAMFYNSNYLADIYEDKTEIKPKSKYIIYNGIYDSTFNQAKERKVSFTERNLEILTVSAMTEHKVIEEVVQSLKILHQKGTKANLNLVGPWSNKIYRSKIENLINHLGLTEYVKITGKVSLKELYLFYSNARVFCLLSRCESFGIPAVEAQTFGTPTVLADVCASPEVAGPGGMVITPGDLEHGANCLQSLLTDQQTWQTYSAKALVNAERFRWEKVSQPFNQFLLHT